MIPMPRLSRLFALLLTGVIAFAPVVSTARPAPAPIAAPVFKSGAVAAPDAFSAAVAKDILQKGGNAVDAGVAVGFALAVTLPEAGNLGGGGFMTVWMDGKPYFLDYRERAPAKASADMYLDAKGEVIEGLSFVGNLSAGTPGTVRGMAQAHARFGRLSWKQVLAPAIALARDGFIVPARLQKNRDESAPDFAGKTNFSAHYAGMTAGARFKQPALAATLERIAAQGDKGFYEGKTADLIVAQMARGPIKGILTRADLASYKAVWREPVRATWNGYDVITAPPPSSGGIALIQLLGMKANLAPAFEGLAHNSPQYIHLIAEIEKRVYADRAEYLGDPDVVKVPVAALIDPAYIRARASEVKALTPSETPKVLPGLEKPQTTHFSVVDRWGNALANTYTLNGSFGSGVVVEGGGFLMNDEMDDFSVKAGVPNVYGVVGGTANAIAPFKTPLSSMTPTILLKDGKVAMVVGTPGGSRIFTWVFQVITNVYDFKMPLQAAVDAQRFHHQLLPENLIMAETFAPLSEPVVKALEARGYHVDNGGWSGDIEAIQVTDGQPVAASDPRARGVSVVVP
jgi:gamma-glutamyltranspeptidase/glutathione hydrolase